MYPAVTRDEYAQEPFLGTPAAAGGPGKGLTCQSSRAQRECEAVCYGVVQRRGRERSRSLGPTGSTHLEMNCDRP